MRAVFSDASIWGYVFTGIAKVIKEGVLRAEVEGLRLKAMDPGHVIMIDLMFPADSFTEYTTEGERLGVNLAEFSKILRRAKSGDRLELATEEGNALEIVLHGRFLRKFREPLLDVEAEEIGEPKIPFKVDARMVADQLREAIRDIEPLGDILGMYATSSKLVFFNESELGRAAVEFSVEEGSLLSLEVEEEEQKAFYSLDYIASILPVAQKAEVVRVQFASEMPCKMTFELPQGAWLALYVAPRTA
uniref:DNA polymerase sliding clamp n=1 Tax=Fervidicoccus fontis TaxID=683846 RepID=A0A7J3ZK86_9CREN